jgi:hypothetical protein
MFASSSYKRVTNGIPLGRSTALTVATINHVQTLKDQGASTARLNGRNLTWVRFPLANITVGPGAVVALKVGTGAELTGLRYAWTDFVDCVLDNGNSSGIPAGPFRHWF